MAARLASELLRPPHQASGPLEHPAATALVSGHVGGQQLAMGGAGLEGVEAKPEVGAEPTRPHQQTPEQFGERMGNVIGWGVVALIVFVYALPKVVALFR